jgi:hypothetical protein
LIALQHAQAFEEGLVPTKFPTYVAGYKTWQALGRNVDRGQKGYAVIAPLRSTRRVAISETGESRRLDSGEDPALGEAVTRTQMLRGFGIEHVFAVEQTTGRELPEPPRPVLLTGEAPRGLGEAVLGLVESLGYTVTTVPDASHIGGANGQTEWTSRTVTLRADMDDCAMVRSLLHETAHALLHEPGSFGGFLPRQVKEVEAESVAYVVALVHEMPSDGYSFPYVVRWAGEAGVEMVQATASRVAGAATRIIAISPAEHGPGGKVPGADLALQRARQLTVDTGVAIRPPTRPDPMRA